MQLTKNFNLSEFESKDGAEMPEHVYNNVRVLATNLQVIRAHVEDSLKVNSGYRSPEHNKAVGGSPKSQHLEGLAADIVPSSMSIESLYRNIEDLIEWGYISEGGLGLYDNFVHYDARQTKARWDFRTKK